MIRRREVMRDMQRRVQLQPRISIVIVRRGGVGRIEVAIAREDVEAAARVDRRRSAAHPGIRTPVSAPVLCVPPAGNAPVHPPVAVQAVALVELHVSVAAEPVVTNVGFALTLTVGTGGGVVTATVAAAGALVPPGPDGTHGLEKCIM